MHIIVLVTSLIFSGGTIAGDYCNSLSTLAESVVDGRYRGITMRQAYDLAEGNSMIQAVVRDAYDLTYFHTEKMQERQAQNFSDQMFAMCLEETNEG